MGGKGGGDSGAQMYQPQQSTIDTNVQPIDLSQDQQFIDVQRAARDATAPPAQPQAAPSLGDVAANALAVPDFLTGQNQQPGKATRTSKLQTTNETGGGPSNALLGGGSV